MKKRVHYSIMEDMRKYLPDFNYENYQLSYSATDSTVIENLRNYYDYCLPVDITAWIRVN